MDDGSSRMSARRLAAGVAIGVALASAGAWAQEGGEDGAIGAWAQEIEQGADIREDRPWSIGVPMTRRAEAREIFLDGNRLIRDMLFAQAAARYKEAIALWDHPAFQYNLAVAQLNLDQPIEAYESLQRALRYGAEPFGARRHEQARSHLALLDRQLARIHVECGEPGARISVDGRVLFTAPGSREGLVRPGVRQVMASKRGRVAETRELAVSPGETARVVFGALTLEMVPMRRWDAWKPWAVVGSGAAALLAGRVLDWRAAAAFDRFDRAFGLVCASGCPDAAVSAPIMDDLHRGRRLRRAAVVPYAAGSLAFSVGVALVYFNRTRLVPSEGIFARRLQITPLLSPGTAGLAGGFTF